MGRHGWQRAHLAALFNSSAFYLWRLACIHPSPASSVPNGLKAAARRVEAIALEVHAENELLMSCSCCTPLAAAGNRSGDNNGDEHELDTQAQSGREGLDPTCPARGYWATSVAAVGRGEARMSNTRMNLNVEISAAIALGTMHGN
ncbi:hypothetical protein HaLaN_25018 [Haematococcus lacustris]|uniref:Uncharacterized protein n=1 Tax=Haematococcus lacustris TaxID=44745 RepID=A0A699ZXQ4_HAELA|nr:hypothetical protein HaLaN_25018 [Haematococcus lacustris]